MMVYQIVSNGDDWEALYIDGKLIKEGHRLTAEDILDTMEVMREYYEVSSEWSYENSMPDTLIEIPADAFN
jgi:hypothetical protein